MQTQLKHDRHRRFFAAMAWLAASVSLLHGVHGAEIPAQGLRISSPGVLDLADVEVKIGVTHPTAIVALDDGAAARILAAASQPEEPLALPFSDAIYGCTPASAACSRDRESRLIAASDGTAVRADKRLRLRLSEGAVLDFIDWRIPTSKTADGDEASHWYLGRLAGSGYERVEVQFGHDAPGSFLVNPKSGKVAFVHNTEDFVALTPNGMQLLTFSTLAPPLRLRLAALDAAGPRLLLQCEAGEVGAATTAAYRLDAVFKGWRDGGGFDLVLELHAARSRLAQRLALRATPTESGWAIATTAPERLHAIGFGCRAVASDLP